MQNQKNKERVIEFTTVKGERCVCRLQSNLDFTEYFNAYQSNDLTVLEKAHLLACQQADRNEKNHDIYYDFLSIICRLSDKIRDLLLQNPENFRFASRGIGLDTVKCMICGKGGMNHNIAAFVENRDRGLIIIKWFSKYHRQFLDYREYEPHRIQAKIGCCDKHQQFLNIISKRIRFGIISKKIVDDAFEEYERTPDQN